MLEPLREWRLRWDPVEQGVVLVTTFRLEEEKRYTLTPAPLGELDQWIKDVGAKWDARLLRLKLFVESEESE